MADNKLKSPVNIPVEKIRPFEGHPYKVLDNDEMNNLIGSIQEQGILSPVLIRPIEDTDEYELISGHRRLHAAVKAGMKKVPAFIYTVSRGEAAIMLVDSNLHREKILPSERAFAYKLKLEALKHQGKRNDITSVQIAPKLSTEQIGEAENISKDTVKRYIRLTNLIPELLDMMDDGKIAFSVGVELSYLDESMQTVLMELIKQYDCTPSYSQAWHIHKDFNEGKLTAESIENMLTAEKPNQKESIKFTKERIQKIAPKINTDDLESFILKACEHYYKYLQRQKNRDAR